MTQHVPVMIEFIHDEKRTTFVFDANTTQMDLLQNFAPDPESTPLGLSIFMGHIPTPPLQSAESMVSDICETGGKDEYLFDRAREMAKLLDKAVREAEPMTTTFELSFIWRGGRREDSPQAFQFKAPEWERASLLTDEIERCGGDDMYDVALDEASLHYPGLHEMLSFLQKVKEDTSLEEFEERFKTFEVLTNELVRTDTPKLSHKAHL